VFFFGVHQLVCALSYFLGGVCSNTVKKNNKTINVPEPNFVVKTTPFYDLKMTVFFCFSSDDVLVKFFFSWNVTVFSIEDGTEGVCMCVCMCVCVCKTLRFPISTAEQNCEPNLHVNTFVSNFFPFLFVFLSAQHILQLRQGERDQFIC